MAVGAPTALKANESEAQPQVESEQSQTSILDRPQWVHISEQDRMKDAHTHRNHEVFEIKNIV